MSISSAKSRRQRFRRAMLLPGRYGFSATRFIRNLEGMVSLLNKHGVVATFPITGVVMERHEEVARVLDGMETAVHGLRHRDCSMMEKDAQRNDMTAAMDVLRAYGFDPVGFRAPYLRWSSSTLQAVAEAGFLYDSSIPTRWTCGPKIGLMDGISEAIQSYGPIENDTHLPTIRGDLVEMPVAIPDDEILVDRLGITSSRQLTEAFTTMMLSAEESGGHIVFQLHPERSNFFSQALESVLRLAKDRGAWIAPLRDVAHWWTERNSGAQTWPKGQPFAVTISGDIDALALGDFLLRRLGR